VECDDQNDLTEVHQKKDRPFCLCLVDMSSITSRGVVAFSLFLCLMFLDIAPNEACELLKDIIKGQVFEIMRDNKQ
jgi:hypothetical protein